MIQAKNITKSFGREKVLDNYSITIEEGKISAIMGASGTGKTTLLRILAGLDKDYIGEIINLPKKAAWVFQEDRLLPWMSVYDNLMLVLEDKMNKSQANTKINNILEKVFLLNDKNKFPNELSGGMKRRVALARAFITENDCLFLDEPFKGLDKSMKDKIAKSLLEWAKSKKTTLILVTHDEEIALLADKTIVLY